MSNSSNKLLDSLTDDVSVLQRTVIDLPDPPTELSRHHDLPDLGMIDLGFSGRFASDHVVHQAIANLTTGDSILLVEHNARWALTDMNRKLIGRMSKKFAPPSATNFLSARVAAIIVRRREDSPEEYQAQICCDRWEVVVPELVFAPAISSPHRA
jgi:ATP-dependent DNA helicase RecQ